MANLISNIFRLLLNIIRKSLATVIFIVLCVGIYLYITKDGIKLAPQTIKVQVEGAVKEPGIKTLLSTAITKDLIDAAGGFASDYDHTYVQEKINLAKKLKDGDKIFVPFKKNEVSNPANISKTGKININKADVSQLDSLPGVGEATANKIITGRPYSNITDLLNKKIVNKSVYTKIEAQIEV